MAKVTGLGIISLLLLLVSHQAYSRLIREVDPQIKPSFLEWRLSSATDTCEPTYGILPCSSNVWGLLFLIVVYEILLSYGGKYVGIGSDLFFKAIGPDHVFGASVFQFLGTIPQIVLVLVTSLSGSVEAAQQRATLGMGLVAGTTVMLFTLLWGSSVVLGSYNLPEAQTANESASGSRESTRTGYGVVTDAETSYTARIILITLIPFVILLLAKVFNLSSGRSWIVLIALVVTVILLFAYMFYQTFQPWIRNRRFEHSMNKYAQDKTLKLFSKNGKPDIEKIQALFNKIDVDDNKYLTRSELGAWLLGVDMDDDKDLSIGMDVESILKSFDNISTDEHISEEEFVGGMTGLVSDLCKQIPDRLKKSGQTGCNSQNNSELQQGLVLPNSNSTATDRRPKATNSWVDYLEAIFFVTFGIAILCALAEPLIKSVVGFSQAANLSTFWVSYLAIPFAMNYGTAVQSIASAAQQTNMSISLTLSTLYGGVYMNNIIGLIVFLAPVYARNLSLDVFAEVMVVLIICVLMTLLTSFRTTFPRWMGYVVVLLYPISLALVYVLNSVSVGL